jgi:hypothetical protein
MAKMDQKRIDLICVDNTGYDGFLTLHKWYKGEVSHSYLPTLKIDNYFYSNLSNDKGKINVYQTKVFMTKQQWRDSKIEKILNG